MVGLNMSPLEGQPNEGRFSGAGGQRKSGSHESGQGQLRLVTTTMCVCADAVVIDELTAFRPARAHERASGRSGSRGVGTSPP